MAPGWAQSGMRGLRPSRAGFLRVSPAAVGLGPATSRSPRCSDARAPMSTSSLPTAPSVSTLARKVDIYGNERGLATPGAVRCASGTVHRTNTSWVQRRRTHSAFAPLPLSAREAGFGQARRLVGRHPSGLAAWSRPTFSTSTDTNAKKPEETTGDGGGDGVPVAEADVAEVAEPTKEEPRHAHIEMPSITDVGGQTGASRAMRDSHESAIFGGLPLFLATVAGCFAYANWRSGVLFCTRLNSSQHVPSSSLLPVLL